MSWQSECHFRFWGEGDGNMLFCVLGKELVIRMVVYASGGRASNQKAILGFG